jgi:hypothetical protein
MTAKDMRYGGTMVGQALCEWGAGARLHTWSLYANPLAVVMSLAQLASGPSFGALIGTGSVAQRFAAFPHAIALSAALSCVGAACCVAARLHRTRKLWVKA